ncbi:hypothetical protein SAY87_032387 [Trapa incisa]|uniref:Uncharacterized protein n=1 Tax=Trapa incisa TaxID=236973 RepID=A0AAN7GDU7_9MYRT|nr:hypothetical protein SAY87_032387 [Trapa incisa]
MVYHVWLLRRMVKPPKKTFIGVNAIIGRFWVLFMMEDVSKNGVLAVQTLRNSIMASTLLASTAVMLSSLIAYLMTDRNDRSHSSLTVPGDPSHSNFSIKCFLIILSFLVTFFFNVQSTRYQPLLVLMVQPLRLASSPISEPPLSPPPPRVQPPPPFPL